MLKQNYGLLVAILFVALGIWWGYMLGRGDVVALEQCFMGRGYEVVQSCGNDIHVVRSPFGTHRTLAVRFAGTLPKKFDLIPKDLQDHTLVPVPSGS